LFDLKQLFGMVFSFAVALACLKYFPNFGFGAVAIVVGFWAGFGFLFVSDTIDNRPIDARTWISQLLNLCGLAIIVGSIFAELSGCCSVPCLPPISVVARHLPFVFGHHDQRIVRLQQWARYSSMSLAFESADAIIPAGIETTPNPMINMTDVKILPPIVTG
jgi:hypothetical protein